MKNTGKAITTVLLGLGALLLIGAILYQVGFRVTPASKTKEGISTQKEQRVAGQPGQRQQAKKQGRVANEQQARGGRASRQEKAATKRTARVQGGALGSEKITLVASGKQSSFTGADLKDLQQVTIAASRGLRSGWRAAEVMKKLGVSKGKELIFVDKAGKTYNVPWEKLEKTEPVVILTYNRMGGLMVMSGRAMTQEELDNTARPEVRAKAKSTDRTERVFFSNIAKIEVIAG